MTRCRFPGTPVPWCMGRSRSASCAAGAASPLAPVGEPSAVELAASAGQGRSCINAMAQTLSLQLVPDGLRGGATSGNRMVAFGALPLGALAGGFVAGAHGLRAPWLAGGLVRPTVALVFLPALLRLPQVTPVRASESEASD